MNELNDYHHWLTTLKHKIKTSQQRAVLAVNSELVLLYWHIGQEILARQSVEGWGAKVIDQLAKDLSAEFPSMKGFSARNLKYMRKFASEWQDEQIVQQLVAQLPWGHNCVLIDKLEHSQDRIWYAEKAIENGWSRNVLVHQIENRLFHRAGKATNNFAQRLPAIQW